jgi:tRNA nucleotidyltransferase (CCA-adding enzyme)
MISIQQIEQKVTEKIIPSGEDKKLLQNVVNKLLEIVNRELHSKNIPASTEIVGSIAKDTFLRNNLDIDLFLVFPTSFSKEYIGQTALELGRKILNNTEECYAEHPYIRGFFKDFKVEIVPCYRIENASQKLSAVDRTPLHTSYIKKHIKEFKKNQVRLLKQFLKGIGCYGAEAEIEGFSGYLCEILILKFQTFQKLVKTAKDWKPGLKLSLNNTHSPDFDTPITFIDPVDKERNVASAVSIDKFNFFVRASNEFLNKPKITYFFPNEPNLWSLEKIQSFILNQDFLYVGIIFSKPDIIAENLHPQIRKGMRSIELSCKRYGFKILDKQYFVDEKNKKVYIILKTLKSPLSEKYSHMGPPVDLGDNSLDFKKKWTGNENTLNPPYEKNGRLYVDVKRRYTNIKDFLIGNISELSMGKDIDKKMQNRYEVVDAKKLVVKDLQEFWTRYLDGRMPWEW